MRIVVVLVVAISGVMALGPPVVIRPPILPPQPPTSGYECPQLECPGKRIPQDCAKAEFIIGMDGQTKCRMCDSNLCGEKSRVCPAIQCPNFNEIKEDCRKPQFKIGSDGITKCPMCPTNLCGPMYKVCPQLQCPLDHLILPLCRVPQFTIGSDGITMCPTCDKDGCSL